MSPADSPELLRSRFVLALGRGLHRNGAPAHRLEHALREVSAALQLEAQFFATPTALFASFLDSTSTDDGQSVPERSHLLRMTPGDVSLHHLVELDQLAQRVLQGRVELAAALAEIERLESAPPLYGRSLQTLGFSVVSGAAARLFGGGLYECLIALLLGAGIGVLASAAASWPPLERLWQPLAAVLVALLASVAASSLALDPGTVIVAAIIVLLPGLTLTIGVTELAQGSLLSGTSRCAGGLLTLALLAFGVTLGTGLASTLGFAPPAPATVALPGWTLAVAVAATPLAFLWILQAPWRDLPWLLLTGIATFSTAAWLSPRGVALAALGGAVVAGVISNGLARLLRRPAMVTRVSSTLLLVPGALSFRGIHWLVQEDTLLAVDTAFDVATILVSIAVGFLLANLLVPPRQRL